MQNLPINTANIQPVTQAQTSNPADTTTQPAESFGNVLARQRVNTDDSKPSAVARDKVQSKSSSPSSPSTDSAPAATGNELETPAVDVASMLPGDMLAALLPAAANTNTSTNSVAATKKLVPQAPSPDGVSTLPSDMLAALLSTSIQQDASAAAQKPAAEGAQGDTRPLSMAAGIQGDARQQLMAGGTQGDTTQQLTAGGARQQLIASGTTGGSKQFASSGPSIGEQAVTSLFRTQSNATPAVATTDNTQDKTFSAALEASGKDAMNTALLAGAKQASAQAALPDAIALNSLTQSAAPPVVASQNGPVQVAVNTPMANDAWGDEFNQKVTWLATQHEQTAELHLNPPHLGPLDIKLNISGDQATALFTSPHAAVREAVEQALPKLREMLADNGIMLGNATVNDQAPKEQQAGQPDKQRGENNSLFGKADEAISISSTVLPARRHLGMVDTFV